jgi:hypothetical protein
MNTLTKHRAVAVVVGSLPERTDTVTASVLAALLEGKPRTSLDSVFEHHTTRLAAVIHHLEKRHGWVISRHRCKVKTKDGRNATVAAYYLPPSVTLEAVDAVAVNWIANVKADRAKAIANGNSASLRRSAPRASAIDQRQMTLWD